MWAGEGMVKWLDAQFAGIFREPFFIHKRDSTEAADIGVVESSTVVEIQAQRGIVELFGAQSAVVDKERACEARLYDEAIIRVEVDDDELRAPPAAEDRRVLEPSRQRPRRDAPKDV